MYNKNGGETQVARLLLANYLHQMVKKTLRLAVPPTLRALARHLSGTCISSWTHKSPCVSLQVHLLFTCSSLIHLSFNYGSLGPQNFQ